MPFDGAFSPLHWLIIGVVALLVLGPDQLPKLARQLARAYNEIARVRRHLSTELRDVVSEFDMTTPQSRTGSPSNGILPSPDVPDTITADEDSRDSSSG
jgi:TatA/E family protein of Tat protein translocase